MNINRIDLERPLIKYFNNLFYIATVARLCLYVSSVLTVYCKI